MHVKRQSIPQKYSIYKKGLAITVDRRWYRNYGQLMGSGARSIAIIMIKKIKRSFFTENII